MSTEQILDKDYEAALNQLYEYEKEIKEHNEKLIKSISRSALKNFNDVLDGCTCTGKVEIVENPKGELQDENYGVFKKVYVQQYSVGDSGDSYAGTIYAFCGKNNKWYAIPYEC